MPIKRIMPIVRVSDNPQPNQRVRVGTKMSRAIMAATGKKPCGFCRKVRDTIDALDKAVMG